MTGHWEFTYGQARVKQVVDNDFKSKVDFVAQNVSTADFGDPVFQPYTMREINGATIASSARRFRTPRSRTRGTSSRSGRSGSRKRTCRSGVNEARAKGAQAVVLLSHNGMDVDLKLASRVTGIDVILGGHTHDAVPRRSDQGTRGGTTLVTNAGCNGKFLGVLDMEVRGGKVQESRYRLVPCSRTCCRRPRDVRSTSRRLRAPFRDKLEQKLATTEVLLTGAATSAARSTS
jgi:sulfur-oxidizing protein SoxB